MSDRLQQGFARLQAGRPLEALEIARAAEGDPNAKYLEGLALRAMGETDAALGAFKVLALTHPLVPDFPNLIGLCQADLGKIDQAVAAFEQALSINPAFVHAAFNLGRTLANDGRMKTAILAYRRALVADANHLPSRRNLAWCLQQIHDLDAAGKEADAALALQPGDPLALSVKASALIADGAYADAAELVSTRLAADAQPVNAALALGKMGEALEKAGEYEGAFAAWARANDGLRAHYAPAFEAVTTGFALPTVQQWADFDLPEFDSETGLEGPAPVFLIGFPRSGTTLMESVLAAHPDIDTSDERPLSTPLIEAAGHNPDAWRAFFGTLPEKRAALRQAYWDGWRAGAPEAGRVFIDKLPLNLAWTPVLAAVFPEAKFLLALRDPRDCVLSAFKQRFGMNAAMYRMLSLDDAAAYYDAAMQAGLAGLETLPGGRLLQVRYEDCVADLEAQARRVIAFLEREWSDEVLAYREKARDRFISTPSAPQVVQPVYQSSTGRWRDYDFALQSVRPVLDPWAQRWGYAD
ncbi:MAG: tetratricopeptide repeat protein [Alphaproteobacteria bacterium]|nr:tetratricopeptide repeat protein [Alphaproteobacteria bacterium]